MIDGVISMFLGGYFFLMGAGVIGKPADAPEKRETQERMKPLLTIGGAALVLFGLARAAGVIE